MATMKQRIAEGAWDISSLAHAREATAQDQAWAIPDVVALEQRIAAEGTSLLQLMNRAGAALAEVVFALRRAADAVHAEGPVVVLAGSGNNGGDGWVAARILHQQGVPVVLVAGKAADELRAEPARTAADAALAVRNSQGAALDVRLRPAPEDLQSLLAGASIVVDALLGTGFAPGSVREPYATWLRLLDACCNQVVVVSADVPSAASVAADVTVTMLRVKDAPYAGKVLLANLEE